MSVEAMSIVLHHSRAVGTDKVVLLGIANHEGDGGAWPSLATLSRYANVNQRSVSYSIRRLESMRELWIGDQQGGSKDTDPRYRTHLYRILLRCPPGCDGTTQHRVGPKIDPGVQPGAPLTDPGVQPSTARGAAGDHPGVQPAAPEPSLEPSVEPSSAAKPAATLRWGQQVVNEWWEAQDPKPAQPYMAIVKLIATLKAKGWTEAEVARALPELPTVSGASLDLWRNAGKTKASPTQARANFEAVQRDEVDRAIAGGDGDLAWRLVRQKARVQQPWIDEIATQLDRGIPDDMITQAAIKRGSRPVTAADVTEVRTMRDQLHARAGLSRGKVQQELTEGPDDDD